VRIDRREQMAQQTRRDILRAARRLFAERGYAATSINDIAEEAGVAIQTIYARLGSKRGMLLALIDLIDEEAGLGPLAEAVTSAGTPLAACSLSVATPPRRSTTSPRRPVSRSRRSTPGSAQSAACCSRSST
jgi:AcrR family transcriptional regulator